MTKQSSSVQTSFDTALNILAHKYRRRLLTALLEHNPQDDDDPQIPGDDELEETDLDSLQIAMSHSHLPKLEEAGFIEWDEASDSVRKGPRFDEIRPLLELMQSHADELPDEWI
jgi:hypothetical protein